MADNFLSYYAGSMAPPLSIDGKLVPVPTILSPAQIYKGILPSTTSPSSPVGPGPGPSGGYAFLQDMVDASTPANPARLTPSSPNVDYPGGGMPPSVLAYGQPGKNYGTGAKMAIDGSGAKAIERLIAPPSVPVGPGAAWDGGWGADAIGRFLAGSHGEVDFTKTRPDMTDAFGRPYSPTVQRSLNAKTTSKSAAAKPPSLLDMIFNRPAAVATPAVPNVAGSGPVTGTQQGTAGYTIYNGNNGVPGNSGNWFNDVTGRG